MALVKLDEHELHRLNLYSHRVAIQQNSFSVMTAIRFYTSQWNANHVLSWASVNICQKHLHCVVLSYENFPYSQFTFEL